MHPVTFRPARSLLRLYDGQNLGRDRPQTRCSAFQAPTHLRYGPFKLCITKLGNFIQKQETYGGEQEEQQDDVHQYQVQAD